MCVVYKFIFTYVSVEKFKTCQGKTSASCAIAPCYK